MPRRNVAAISAIGVAVALLAGACSASQAASPPAGSAAGPGVIAAVGAENQYANVISQVGGAYVRVTAVESNPNTDPHSFEASPGVAEAISSARLVVQNGLGYDSFMNKIESASPSRSRTVIDVARLLGLPAGTPNPHLWYAPGTMPAVAKAVARALARVQPAHASYFAANERRFDDSLRPWYRALARLRAAHPGVPVAATEPVGDYLLQAARTHVRTPFTLQADIMNGVDLAPQYVALQDGLLSGHRVAALVYNQQVADSLTESFLATARRSGVPVVGVYETMPAGYDYQSWMLAETRALARAFADKVSTERLP